MSTLFQLFVYPGLLWVCSLTLVLIAALGRGARGTQAIRKTWLALLGQGSLAHALSVVLALVAIALLPWPASPFAPVPPFDLWRTWALIEGCFLVALLPGLLSSLPAVNRAAVREAQIGVSGRAVLWIALLVGFGWRGETLVELGPLLLGAAAALLALPAAARWQPFGGESGLGLGDADSHLPHADIGVARWSHDLRSVLLITLIASVFVTAPGLAWWQQLGLKVWLALAVALVGRGLKGGAVHRTIRHALRFCWLIVLPLAAVALAGRIWLGA
ncbi:MAG: hypothetical protein M3R24_21690 [Chloroflexota bacterium]|nr:hypothetical protein [Chloroflexota bacterium]